MQSLLTPLRAIRRTNKDKDKEKSSSSPSLGSPSPSSPNTNSPPGPSSPSSGTVVGPQAAIPGPSTANASASVALLGERRILPELDIKALLESVEFSLPISGSGPQAGPSSSRLDQDVYTHPLTPSNRRHMRRINIQQPTHDDAVSTSSSRSSMKDQDTETNPRRLSKPGKGKARISAVIPYAYNDDMDAITVISGDEHLEHVDHATTDVDIDASASMTAGIVQHQPNAITWTTFGKRVKRSIPDLPLREFGLGRRSMSARSMSRSDGVTVTTSGDDRDADSVSASRRSRRASRESKGGRSGSVVSGSGSSMRSGHTFARGGHTRSRSVGTGTGMGTWTTTSTSAAILLQVSGATAPIGSISASRRSSARRSTISGALPVRRPSTSTSMTRSVTHESAIVGRMPDVEASPDQSSESSDTGSVQFTSPGAPNTPSKIRSEYNSPRTFGERTPAHRHDARSRAGSGTVTPPLSQLLPPPLLPLPRDPFASSPAGFEDEEDNRNVELERSRDYYFGGSQGQVNNNGNSSTWPSFLGGDNENGGRLFFPRTTSAANRTMSVPGAGGDGAAGPDGQQSSKTIRLGPSLRGRDSFLSFTFGRTIRNSNQSQSQSQSQSQHPQSTSVTPSSTSTRFSSLFFPGGSTEIDERERGWVYRRRRARTQSRPHKKKSMSMLSLSGLRGVHVERDCPRRESAEWNARQAMEGVIASASSTTGTTRHQQQMYSYGWQAEVSREMLRLIGYPHSHSYPATTTMPEPELERGLVSAKSMPEIQISHATASASRHNRNIGLSTHGQGRSPPFSSHHPPPSSPLFVSSSSSSPSSSTPALTSQLPKPPPKGVHRDDYSYSAKLPEATISTRSEFVKKEEGEAAVVAVTAGDSDRRRSDSTTNTRNRREQGRSLSQPSLQLQSRSSPADELQGDTKKGKDNNEPSPSSSNPNPSAGTDIGRSASKGMIQHIRSDSENQIRWESRQLQDFLATGVRLVEKERPVTPDASKGGNLGTSSTQFPGSPSSYLSPPAVSVMVTAPTPQGSPGRARASSSSTDDGVQAANFSLSLNVPPEAHSTPRKSTSGGSSKSQGKRKAEESDEGSPPGERIVRLSMGSVSGSRKTKTSFAATEGLERGPHRVSNNSSHAPSSFSNKSRKRVRLSSPITTPDHSRPPSAAAVNNPNANTSWSSKSSRATSVQIQHSQHSRPSSHRATMSAGPSTSVAHGTVHSSRHQKTRSISQASIPLSAIVSPRAPSVEHLSKFHMRDPRKPRRRPVGWGLRFGTPDDVGSPLHAWCFWLGLLFPLLWWLASFAPIPKTRFVGIGAGQGVNTSADSAEKGITIDDPHVERESRTWRKRCRIASVVFFFTYAPIIILLAVFATR